MGVLVSLALLLTAAPESLGQSSDEAKAPSGGQSEGQATSSPQLLQEAEQAGSVRAIVRLRTDFVPQGRLSRAEAADQQTAIGTAQAGLRAELQGTGYQTLREFETVPFIVLELTPEAIRAAQASPRVSSIVEDRALAADLAQSAPIVQAPTMWNNGFTGSGQVIAVLDTGVESGHPFLAGKVVEEACFSGNANCPNGLTTQTGAGSGAPCTYAPDGCRHGTHVAGIAAGQGTTFSGVARGANVMAVQVFSRFTGQNCIGDVEDPCTLSFISDQIAGLERVFNLRATRNFAAVNMSLGGGQFFSNCDAEPHKAMIDNLRSVGIATVIASGNDGFTSSMGSPGCISSAVSVGSTTKADAISSFSNSASFLHLLAPGSAINSSVPGGGFAAFNGTSMATPHVAGAWALLKQQHPNASVTSVLSALQSTGTSVTDTRPGGGITKPRINIANAAAAIGAPLANDNFSGSQALAGATASTTGNNGSATKESGEPNHAGDDGGKSVWYRWTPPSSGTATIDTVGSGFDTLLAVYTGGAVNALTEVASNDDVAAGNTTSRVTFPADAGTTYRIAVDGFNNGAGAASGNFALNVASSAPGGDSTPPVVNLTAPANNAVVRGSAVTLSASATDNVGVSRVEFLVRGSVVGTDTTAPYSVSWDSRTIADGRKTVSARAVDAANNQGTSAASQLIVDNFFPDTAINAGPPRFTTSTRATFRFSSSSPDVIGFQCSLDGGAFTPCASPKVYSRVRVGTHRFRVRAIGSAGAVVDADPSPATRTWTVRRR